MELVKIMPSSAPFNIFQLDVLGTVTLLRGLRRARIWCVQALQSLIILLLCRNGFS